MTTATPDATPGPEHLPPSEWRPVVELLPDEMPLLDYSTKIDLLRPMRLMFWVAILSGLCVASCFFVAWTNFAVYGYAIHMAIYAATLGLAVWAGAGMNSNPVLRSQARMVMDLMAGGGLAIIGLAPLGGKAMLNNEHIFLPMAAVAFGLMAVSVPRHLLLYRAMGNLFRPLGYRGLAGSLVAIGWIKLFYEGVWLGCCALGPIALSGSFGRDAEGAGIFLALGALFGCIGYGAIWIYMIVVHARAAVVTRRLTAS